MLLAPDISYDEAHNIMKKIYQNFQNDEYQKDKVYSYSISYGITAVEPDNKMAAGDILSIADEKMYENKRANKKARAQNK
jgi:GGDEF domain-containing protein